MINNKPYKINIDHFKTTKEFEYFLFVYIKREYFKNKGIKKIVIYTINQEITILNYVVNEFIPKLEKIYDSIISKWYIIKLINFPYCIVKDEKIIEKYFFNKILLFHENIPFIDNNECLKCEYCLSCLKYKGKDYLLTSFNSKYIENKESIDYKFTLVTNFLKNIWLNDDDFFIFTYFLNTDSYTFLNKKLLDRTEIHFFWEEIYNKYFISSKKYRKNWETLPNIFFKNYIIQKRFEKLINKLNFSIHLEFHNLKETNYNLSFEEYYNKYCIDTFENDLNFFLSLDFSLDKRVEIWQSFYWSVWVKENSLLLLNVIDIKNIHDIKYDFNKYIVLIWNQNINFAIPYIYKFKYLLSCSFSDFDLNITSHYKILANEIWIKYIDSVDYDYFFWIRNNDLLEIDFNTWLIKRVW